MGRALRTKIGPSECQVAIAGKVVDGESGRPQAGVRVTVVEMPAAFRSQLEAWALRQGRRPSSASGRPDVALTAADGCFRFVNLPDGGYTLSFSAPGGAKCYGPLRQEFEITRDASGQIPLSIATIALPPTAIRGSVLFQDVSDSPFPLARVSVSDGDARTYVDDKACFYLTGVEPGARLLRISAPGYQPTTLTANVEAGQLTELSPALLEPLTESRE